ncbi:uncharacterized protein LOC133174989 [Saccostrea echinata]|uniref:uncharacterized protein LOC133174989 n=1 Tax=Saccostrea echinata TaxID=191078 RepID=UPI002A7F58F6|nr:uncharacterized protein LOC133174989 [Saccostrea echinata]
MTRFLKEEIHLFILTHGEEEEVSNWVCELVTALQSKNIHCVKEEDYAMVGENVYCSLERSINSSRNVMVVISPGFLRKADLTERLNLAFKQTIEREIPLIPVLSVNIPVTPYILSTTVCMYVDFSRNLLQEDVKKIERSLRRKEEKGTTKEEIDQILLSLDKAIDQAPFHVLSAVRSTPRFKKLCQFFSGSKKRNRSNFEEKENGFLVTIRRTLSDTSGMYQLKELYSRVGSQNKLKSSKPRRSHSFGHRVDISKKTVIMNLGSV